MRLSKSWIIASKDFKTFKKKKSIVYSTLFVPIFIAVLFPVVITIASHRNTAAVLPTLLPSFAFFYVILAGFLPTAIASYSIVGEKLQKSLEPLLATPATDGEIMLGKGISAFLPPLMAILGGSVLFMVLMDLATFGTLGYYFFPNLNAVIILFLMVPLATLMGVEWNVFVSSKVSDIRISQQIGALIILPLAGVYVAGEIDLIDLGNNSILLIISAILLLVDLSLFYVAKATFQREEILTKWK